jgi:hypothetical protein
LVSCGVEMCLIPLLSKDSYSLRLMFDRLKKIVVGMILVA